MRVLKIRMKNLEKLSPIRLLRDQFEILEELKKKGIIRTRNSPIADYAEWLVCKKMDMCLMKSSTKGLDAIDKNGKKYQIKTRHLISPSSSRQLGVIRNLGGKEFDRLIAVLFDKEFNIKEAYEIPAKIIGKYARYSKHQNGHILILRGMILKDKKIKRIDRLLKWQTQ